MSLPSWGFIYYPSNNERGESQPENKREPEPVAGPDSTPPSDSGSDPPATTRPEHDQTETVNSNRPQNRSSFHVIVPDRAQFSSVPFVLSLMGEIGCFLWKFVWAIR